MQRANRELEEKLLAAVDAVAERIEADNLSPNEAVAKVASDLKLPRQWLPVLVQAYNHGRAATQQQQCGDLQCKLAAFPLADVREVYRLLYPEDVPSPAQESAKTAVSSEYAAPPRSRNSCQACQDDSPPAWKEAIASVRYEEYPRDPASAAKRNHARYARAKLAVEKARGAAHDARMCLLDAIGDLVEYFSKVAIDRLPLSVVEYNAARRWGKGVVYPICDAVRQACGSRAEKRASAPQISSAPPRFDRPPYIYLDRAIGAAREVWETYRKYEQALAEFDKVARELSPAARSNADRAEYPWEPLAADAEDSLPWAEPSGEEKQAITVGDVSGGILGGAIASALSEAVRIPTRKELVEKSIAEIGDPLYSAELAKLRTQVALHDLLSNDPVISGYSPQEVFDAYNELATLAPRAALQPAILRPYLRRRLAAGVIEPFDVEQLSSVEDVLRKTTGPGLAEDALQQK